MDLSQAQFCVVDVETTGLDPQEDRIVEIACVNTNSFIATGMWASLVSPGKPIPPEVSAVHYLTDTDVASAPSWLFVEPFMLGTVSRDSIAFVAHNAAFDKAFVSRTDSHPLVDVERPAPKPWICTKRLAQHLWPNAPTYKNQGLRFWRDLKVDTFGILPHRALGDALVTAALLRDILCCSELYERGIETVEQLIELSQAPILFTQWPKGKYYGKPLDTDLSYVEWALGPRGMTDMDPDLRYSLETVLKNA